MVMIVMIKKCKYILNFIYIKMIHYFKYSFFFVTCLQIIIYLLLLVLYITHYSLIQILFTNEIIKFVLINNYYVVNKYFCI